MVVHAAPCSPSIRLLTAIIARTRSLSQAWLKLATMRRTDSYEAHKTKGDFFFLVSRISVRKTLHAKEIDYKRYVLLKAALDMRTLPPP